jgi:bile acid:Na+ symporter, BASS family
MNLTTLILLILKTSIVLIVLALGLKATVADATSLFRRPHHLVRALLSMNVVMPLFALALALSFNLHPAVKIALVALSVSPLPPLLPRKALKVGGREDYIVGLLVAMALLAIIVIPVTMKIFERFVGVPLQMPVLSIASLVLSTILGPLSVGIVVRMLAPWLAERAARPVGILGLVLLILSVLPVLFISGRTILSLIGNGTVLSFAAFALVGLLVGYRFGGPEPESRRVLALATSARHPGVAVAIAHANFPQEKLVVPAIVLYLIVSGILCALTLARRKRAESAATETDKRMAA